MGNTDKIGHIGSPQLLKVDRTLLVPERSWTNKKEQRRQRKAEKMSTSEGFEVGGKRMKLKRSTRRNIDNNQREGKTKENTFLH